MARVIQKPYEHDMLIAQYNNLLLPYKRTLSVDDIRDIVEIHVRYAIGAITLPHVYTDYTTTINEVLSLDIFLGVQFELVDTLLQVVDRYLEQLVRIIVQTNDNYNMTVTDVYSDFYMVR